MDVPQLQPVQSLPSIQDAFSPIAAVSDGYKTEQLPPAPATQHVLNADGYELTPSQYQVSVLFIYST